MLVGYIKNLNELRGRNSHSLSDLFIAALLELPSFLPCAISKGVV